MKIAKVEAIPVSYPEPNDFNALRHLCLARITADDGQVGWGESITQFPEASFAAKAVIQASGGAGQCFRPTTNALICTGDGIAQSYRIGAPLMDMEMIQYHPTTLAGNGILITEGARGEGAHLYNAEGERFMEKYAPNKMELASRDVVSRAEQTEINEGRGYPDGTVALDITKVPRKRTLEALREIVNIGKDFAGVDITREPIHIRPGCHYIMGHVRTDTWGATPIPGLYAAGEVACVSVHGCNRLGANSLLDTLVFGRRSGEHAARRALAMAMPTPAQSALAAEETEPGVYVLKAQAAGDLLVELATWLRAADVLPSEVRVGAESLEEVFLRLTRREP